MNQKGFIPIILIVIGVVALASATFGVVKYKDEIAATVSEIFVGFKVKITGIGSTGGDEVIEEVELVEESIIEELVLGPAEVLEPARPPEPEEAAEEEITEEEVTEEEVIEEEVIEEEIVEEEVIEKEVIRPKAPSRPSYAAMRAPSDSTSPIISNIKVSDITENSTVISWHTNENGSGAVEYGLASDSYEFSTSGIVSEAYTGYDHTVSLSGLSGNTIYHYRVASTDNSENHNTARSEEDTFLTLLDLPIITSHTNNQLLNAEDYADFELVGTAEPNAFVLIQANLSYETAVDDKGDWEQPDVALEEGENIITIKAENDTGNESRDVSLILYADSQIPVTEIWITNYASDSYNFTVNWSSSEYPDCTFDVGYLDDEEDWNLASTSLTSKDFIALGDGTYTFQARATDLAGNIGEWSEVVEVEVSVGEYEYNDGYNNGYADGEDNGYYDGYEGEEYEDGYDDEYEEEYEGEYGDGYEDGYGEGYEYGYNNGYNDGCDDREEEEPEEP